MQQRSPAAVGFRAGAIAGAITRFIVALGFVYYVSRWGGKWWDGVTEMLLGALVSAAIGAGVGGVAGWTCRPILGACVGALLSCASCLTLFVLPTSVMLGMSHPGGLDRIETSEMLYGMIAMTLAGGLSGFIGATFGRRAARSR